MSKAYPLDELARTSGRIEDRLGENEVIIHFDGEAAWAETAAGDLLPAVRLYWFAWYGFHPDTFFDAIEAKLRTVDLVIPQAQFERRVVANVAG